MQLQNSSADVIIPRSPKGMLEDGKERRRRHLDLGERPPHTGFAPRSSQPFNKRSHVEWL